jgi:sugar/nucleoside kinase (ribokinase family)
VTHHHVLIVGSMAFDDLELPTGTFPDTIGGSATYSALACSAFAPARVVAVVGDDFPQTKLELLQARGVDVTGIERAAGKTFRWAGRYDADLVGRTSLDTQLNVFADFRPKIPDAWRSTPLVLLGNIHPALQAEVLEKMEAPKLVVADTMNFWISGEAAALAALLRRVDILIINDEEARQLSGIHNISRAAASIRKRGPKRLIIKRGEHGALLFDDQGIFAVPGFPLEDVIDPTGAGDSFAGGFIGYLATQPQIISGQGVGGQLSSGVVRRAMIHGTATASHCVEAVGTSRVAQLAEGEIERRVQEILRLFSMD